MSAYEPTKVDSRKELAAKLIEKLEDCGFEPGTKQWGTGAYDDTTSELMFSREHHAAPGIEVVVYTSCIDKLYSRGGETIVKPIARTVAKDAIRVAVVYKGGSEPRGLGKSKRVNRVGDVDAIVERMVERMREMYGSIPSVERCHCGAPKFTSKAGNLVCADVCWTK